MAEFQGALLENYMAQALQGRAIDKGRLFYWTSSGIAEIDFVVNYENLILPLEVKSGVSTKSKSLAV